MDGLLGVEYGALQLGRASLSVCDLTLEREAR